MAEMKAAFGTIEENSFIIQVRKETENSKQRFLNVLERKKTVRLPVTTHQLMPSFLNGYMGGISEPLIFI